MRHQIVEKLAEEIKREIYKVRIGKQKPDFESIKQLIRLRFTDSEINDLCFLMGHAVSNCNHLVKLSEKRQSIPIQRQGNKLLISGR